jgi:hypothetical protein
MLSSTRRSTWDRRKDLPQKRRPCKLYIGCDVYEAGGGPSSKATPPCRRRAQRERERRIAVVTLTCRAGPEAESKAEKSRAVEMMAKTRAAVTHCTLAVEFDDGRCCGENVPNEPPTNRNAGSHDDDPSRSAQTAEAEIT